MRTATTSSGSAVDGRKTRPSARMWIASFQATGVAWLTPAMSAESFRWRVQRRDEREDSGCRLRRRHVKPCVHRLQQISHERPVSKDAVEPGDDIGHRVLSHPDIIENGLSQHPPHNITPCPPGEIVEVEDVLEARGRTPEPQEALQFLDSRPRSLPMAHVLSRYFLSTERQA